MNYFKILGILFLCLFNNQTAFSSDWVLIKSDKQDVWLDESNIREENNSLYYAIRFNDKNSQTKTVIVQSKGKNAGVVKTITPKFYSNNPDWDYFITGFGEAGEFRELTQDSLLYNANNRAMEISGYNGNIDLGQADFTEYLKALEAKMRKCWMGVRESEQFLDVANVNAGEVVLSLKIATDGRLLKYGVNNLSDNPKLAEIVTKTVGWVLNSNCSGKYITNMLPYGFKGNSINIDVKFSYAANQVVAEVVTPNVNVKTDKTDIQNDAEINSYMKDLQKRIKRKWHPSQSITSYQVVVLFKISKTGQLLDYKIKKSSYNRYTDNMAIEAIKNTKFKALPSNLKEESVDIEFSFDYNATK